MSQGRSVLVGVLVTAGVGFLAIGVNLMLGSDERAEWYWGWAFLVVSVGLLSIAVVQIVRMGRLASAPEREAEAARRRGPSLVLRNLVEELEHVCRQAPSLDPYEPQNMGSIRRAKVQEALTRTENQIPTITDDKKRQAVRDIARRVEGVVKGGDKNRYAALDTVRQQAHRLLAEWDKV